MLSSLSEHGEDLSTPRPLPNRLVCKIMKIHIFHRFSMKKTMKNQWKMKNRGYSWVPKVLTSVEMEMYRSHPEHACLNTARAYPPPGPCQTCLSVRSYELATLANVTTVAKLRIMQIPYICNGPLSPEAKFRKNNVSLEKKQGSEDFRTCSRRYRFRAIQPDNTRKRPSGGSRRHDLWTSFDDLYESLIQYHQLLQRRMSFAAVCIVGGTWSGKDRCKERTRTILLIFEKG